jgi:hypothetical protein
MFELGFFFDLNGAPSRLLITMITTKDTKELRMLDAVNWPLHAETHIRLMCTFKSKIG